MNNSTVYAMSETNKEGITLKSFSPPPKPNVKITFGEDAWLYFQYHVKTPPNRFQRWMIKKLLGIKVEML